MRKIFLALFLILVFPAVSYCAEIPYNYNSLEKDIAEIREMENAEVFSIGQSEYGREIYAVKIGKGENIAIMLGTAHAREWINSALLGDMMKDYINAYNNYENIGNYYAREILDNCSIVFIPMQNPDGVELQQKGLSAFTLEQQEEIKKIGYTNKYKNWKANAKGVDLNRQQNINWDRVGMNEPYPSYHNHKGNKPEQASEAIAVINYIKKTNPKALISFHSSGQVIFWSGCNADKMRDYNFAKKISSATGYFLVKEGASPPAGGMSPWFRHYTGGMALTIETGRFNDESEVRHKEFPEIYNRNHLVGIITANEVYQNWLRSPEMEYKLKELQERYNLYKKQGIEDLEAMLNDIRYLKQLTKDNRVTIIKDNELLDIHGEIRNEKSIVDYLDATRVLVEPEPTVSRSTPLARIGAVVINDKVYVPITNFKHLYNIKWDRDSQTVLLETRKD